jgi:sugar lactone lactonase YvrE
MGRSSNWSVYEALPGDSVLRQFVPAGSAPQANGIAVSPDETALFVAGGFGIVRVDLRTRAVTPLSRAAGVIDATIDGLYGYRRSLIGIQNGVHPGRVLRFDLDSTLTGIVSSTVLESYNPLFDSPTTGAVSGNAFYFMANPQRRRLVGGVPDSSSLNPVRVLRLPLRP